MLEPVSKLSHRIVIYWRKKQLKKTTQVIFYTRIDLNFSFGASDRRLGTGTGTAASGSFINTAGFSKSRTGDDCWFADWIPGDVLV